MTDSGGEVSAPATITVNIRDDGPSLTAEVDDDEALVHNPMPGVVGDADDIAFDGLPTAIQERFSGVGNPGDDPSVADIDKDNGALGFAANSAALVTVTAADFGTDGAADTAATVYALAIGGDNGAVDSGLDTGRGAKHFSVPAG